MSDLRRPTLLGTEVRALGHLALPLVLGQFTQLAMHAIDTAMVGRLGIEAVAASSIGNVTTGAVFLTLGAIGAALPPLAARALAAGDRPSADRFLRHAWLSSAVLSLVAIAGFAFALRWLPLTGQPEAVLDQARPYALVLIWSLLPMMLLQNLRGYAEAHSRPWLPLGNIVLGLVVNVACNLVLIYGAGPVPALGVPGAAIGTGIARVAMLVHFAIVLHRRPEVRPSPGWWRHGGWSRAVFTAYLRLGLMSAAAILLVIGSGLVVYLWAARLGPAALAAHEIARQVWVLGYVVPLGWSFAVGLRVAMGLGVRDEARLRATIRAALLVGGVAGLMLGALVWLGRHALPSLFLGATPQPEVAASATALLVVVSLIFACEGLFLAAVGVCRGLGRMAPVALAYLASYWGVGLALGHWLGAPHRHGVVGLWLGPTLGLVGGAFGLAWFCIARARRLADAGSGPTPR
jgi:MATE family multidrug resistance protein